MKCDSCDRQDTRRYEEKKLNSGGAVGTFCPEHCPEAQDLELYKKQLKAHDWFYDFSDDGRVWRAGWARRNWLLAIAKNNDDEFKKAFNEEHSNHFNPERGFSTSKPPFDL